MRISTSLGQIRKARNLSAAELAKQVSVSRQTIYSIEDGTFIPNTAIALKLARVLNVRVEDLFSTDDPEVSEEVEAEILDEEAKPHSGDGLRLCRVYERFVAVRPSPMPSFLPYADAVALSSSGSRVRASPIEELCDNRIVVAGCDPALSLLAPLLSRAGFDLVLVSAASRRALEWLKQRRIHVAGVHLKDHHSGNYNIPLLERSFEREAVQAITFATWEQGLVIAAGNPKGIHGIADLGNDGLVLMNREKGSGSRDLLDRHLKKLGLVSKSIAGYENVAPGHFAAAYAVASGVADCCVAPRLAARSFGLDFLPLSEERFDLILPSELAATNAGRALLEALNDCRLRRQLRDVAGYDPAQTGAHATAPGNR